LTVDVGLEETAVAVVGVAAVLVDCVFAVPVPLETEVDVGLAARAVAGPVA
jgi:hypothetical protein